MGKDRMIGLVCVFRSEAMFGSEVWAASGSCGGHQLLPAKVLLSLWSPPDAGLHSLCLKSIMRTSC